MRTIAEQRADPAWMASLPDWKRAEIEAEEEAYRDLRALHAEVAPTYVAIAERIRPGDVARMFDRITHDLYSAMMDAAGYPSDPPASSSEPVARPLDQPRRGRETAVYRAFDGAGRLLYIGVTKSPHARMRGHETTSEWWPEMQSVVFEWLPSREAALDLERSLIETLRPPFNVEHHPERIR